MNEPWACTFAGLKKPATTRLTDMCAWPEALARTGGRAKRTDARMRSAAGLSAMAVLSALAGVNSSALRRICRTTAGSSMLR